MANASNIDASTLASDIITYYDDCEIDYKWIWHLKDQSALHYGYWTEDTEHIGVALQNTNKFVSDQLAPQEGDQILDAGCGVGGTSRYLSQRFNVHVHGITLSEKQVKTATELTSQVQLKGSAEFSTQDYCHTSFPNDHFDCAYAIESVCHAQEKEDFLKEAHRILKKDGTLVVAGFFATKNIVSEADHKCGLFRRMKKSIHFLTRRTRSGLPLLMTAISRPTFIAQPFDCINASSRVSFVIPHLDCWGLEIKSRVRMYGQRITNIRAYRRSCGNIMYSLLKSLKNEYQTTKRTHLI
jgi:cyclopropane fatty-acyl-phospholipid synthase-like methyltransferase